MALCSAINRNTKTEHKLTRGQHDSEYHKCLFSHQWDFKPSTHIDLMNLKICLNPGQNRVSNLGLELKKFGGSLIKIIITRAYWFAKKIYSIHRNDLKLKLNDWKYVGKEKIDPGLARAPKKKKYRIQEVEREGQPNTPLLCYVKKWAGLDGSACYSIVQLRIARFKRCLRPTWIFLFYFICICFFIGIQMALCFALVTSIQTFLTTSEIVQRGKRSDLMSFPLLTHSLLGWFISPIGNRGRRNSLFQSQLSPSLKKKQVLSAQTMS